MKSWRSCVIYALLLTGGALAAEITKIEASNVSKDESRAVEYLESQYFNTKIGATEQVTVTAFAFNTKESCFIKTPNGEQYTITKDLNLPGLEIVEDANVACGVSVTIQSEDMIGDWELIAWELRYSDPIEKRLPFTIHVEELWNSQSMDLVWAKDKAVDVTIGPDNAIYCKIEDPSGFTVVDSFGKCNIVLAKAEREHSGTWKMTVGYSGKVLTEDYDFTVTVREAARKPEVTTHVEKQRPQVILTCSVPTEYEVRTCKFRDPSGRVLIANEGIGESRYTFHGAGVSLNSEVRTHECGLRIANPQNSDLGLWRCAVETDQEIYYGFLTVLCPWAMSDPNVAASVVSEPTLTAHANSISALQGDAVTMSCSVQAAINYCYFRVGNGTVFNVSPGTSSNNFEYVGAGLDAGECGIKFNNMLTSDTGRWSCHVGFMDLSEPEQRAAFDVTVNEAIVAQQFVEQENTLVIQGQVYNNRQLEYCRYVRIDGQGITSATLPNARYTTNESLNTGGCALRIQEASVMEHHPWTVVARILGQDVEISAVTTHTISMPPAGQPGNSFNIVLWVPLIILGIVLLALATLLVPKRNRRRTFDRISIMRDSFRSSFQKKPLHHPAQDTGVMAA
ncbi:uncharacterized protein ACR2FA_003773 [Aphomia sociella]